MNYGAEIKFINGDKPNWIEANNEIELFHHIVDAGFATQNDDGSLHLVSGVSSIICYSGDGPDYANFDSNIFVACYPEDTKEGNGMTKFKKEMLGVVSEGTLKEVDLVLAIVNTYYRMKTYGFIQYNAADSLRVSDLEFFRRMILAGKMDMNEEFIAEEFWYRYREVEDAINEVCYKYDCWYGSHPDDPACIGIWENVEE